MCGEVTARTAARSNASFVVSPDSVNVGNVIIYNTSSGYNPDYHWNFGDGNNSNLQFPNHTYSGSGPYYLCLTIVDSLANGYTCSNTYCDSINSGGVVFRGGSGFTISVVPPSITNIENTSNQISNFSIYPNPLKNTLTIDLSIKEKSDLDVFVTDLLGNIVSKINTQNKTVGINKFTWDATAFPEGLYLLNIKTNKKLLVKKIILNK